MGVPNLKWLMDWRTASSNSMGPGIRSVLWAGCDDILRAGGGVCRSLADTSLTEAIGTMSFIPCYKKQGGGKRVVW